MTPSSQGLEPAHHPGRFNEAGDVVIRMSVQVIAEDIAICESMQRNLGSGSYDTGWLSPNTNAACLPYKTMGSREHRQLTATP
jgi:hypothetical protein